MGESVHCPELDPRLHSIILERCLAYLGQPNTYSLIGGRTCGSAYLSGGKVYKITTDKSEAIESNKILGKHNQHLVDIYNVKKVNNTMTDVDVYLIVMEHLRTDRQGLFAEIEEALINLFEEHFNVHLFDIIHYYRFSPDIYKNEFEHDINDILAAHQREKYYYDSLLKIADELNANGIESEDMQYHNLGLKPNGNLGFFDLGYGDTKGNVGSIGINEDDVDREYSKWKRDNVTYRGISDTAVDGENGGMAMLGQGLYSVPASNKAMARKYGTLALLVNAKPKNPKIFNTLNDWEIWFQNNVVYPISKSKGKSYPDARDVNSISEEMMKRGYDGVIIKGREIVNYKPENVKYFYSERQLENHYYDFVKPESLSERVMSYMKNSSAVGIKKNCMLGGNGDGTSEPCNKGDIKNIKLKPIKEEKFYRVDSGFNPPRGTTALDVVNFEAEENGNDEEMMGALLVAREHGIDLSKYPASRLMWVTKTPEAATRYGNPQDVEEFDLPNPVILADDGDNGYLVFIDSKNLV